MNKDIKAYNNRQLLAEKEVCNLLSAIIGAQLPESTSKIWHANPVWFLDANPIVGYSKQKGGIRLMFWSGADFKEDNLQVKAGQKFKDASIFYNNAK